MTLSAGHAAPPACRAASEHFDTDSGLPNRPGAKFVRAVLRSSVPLVYAKVSYDPALGLAPACRLDGPSLGTAAAVKGGPTGGGAGGKSDVILYAGIVIVGAAAAGAATAPSTAIANAIRNPIAPAGRYRFEVVSSLTAPTSC